MDRAAPHPWQEDFEDFFEHSLNGYLILDADGYVLRSNRRFAEWVGGDPDALRGTRFSDHLRIGAKIFYETHLAPLLRMQGHFDEVAVDLGSSAPLSVLVNAYERRDVDGSVKFVRVTVYKATDRRTYENNLKSARDLAQQNLIEEQSNALLREQFIAVLGHDLRNPLGAIASGATILEMSSLDPRQAAVVGVIKRSAARILDLVDNIMDFARGRLGGGMALQRVPVFLEPALVHVVDELRAVWPARQIATEFAIPGLIECDAARVAQLLSNLVSNALTHGAPEGAVIVKAFCSGDVFELSVSNSGTPIPDAALSRIFQPFKRESVRSSQGGLGLGLYIASEIARAHNGTLTAISNDAETRFTFRMPTTG